MLDFIFNGTISTTNKNKDLFLEDFTKFLQDHNASFKGSLRIDEFDEVEIIND